MIRINNELCDICGECIDVCPVDKLIYASRSDIGTDPEVDCINCQSCIEVCPTDAITITDD